MSALSVLYLTYTVVLVLGAATWYVKAKSARPFNAGLLPGALMSNAFGWLWLGPTRPGLILGSIISVTVAGFFIQHYRATKKAVPTVPVWILSAVVLIVSLVKLF